ncbi:AGC/DMPK protein kinase [Fonticula alba]|uniref:non-specific serine/threonine protein kinase n=1 Tax=Fonticula alba TaxID=691883 RepID=A0A058ZEV6_FONAL|nr:AGC/DMPK protein kinase [Fonticula alba]KCV72461.1 AGC/DMPK protein kinase [Fonticula alba]|eukprot:XP_009492162.1 AGC/DMPK protein kinase [Fonticula alba]
MAGTAQPGAGGAVPPASSASRAARAGNLPSLSLNFTMMDVSGTDRFESKLHAFGSSLLARSILSPADGAPNGARGGGRPAGRAGPTIPATDQPINLSVLVDGFLSLYESCSNPQLMGDSQIARFVDTFRPAVDELHEQLAPLRLESYMFLAVIGRGSCGEVLLVRSRVDNRLYALKVLSKNELLRRHGRAMFFEERQILQTLGSSHAAATGHFVTRYHAAFQDAAHLFLLMDYYPGGDLAALQRRIPTNLDEQAVRFYIAQLVVALEALHEAGFIHRDLRPDNVLIDADGHVRLADFGVSIPAASNAGYRPAVFHQRAGSSSSMVAPVPTPAAPLPCRSDVQVVGSGEYLPPEALGLLFSSQPGTSRPGPAAASTGAGATSSVVGYGQGSDWWSLGVLAYELLIGWTPFYPDEDFIDDDTPADQPLLNTYQKLERFTEHVIFPKERLISAECRDFIRSLLSTYGERLGVAGGAAAVRAHPWFAGIPWDQLRTMAPPFVPDVLAPDDISNFDLQALEESRSHSVVQLAAFMAGATAGLGPLSDPSSASSSSPSLGGSSSGSSSGAGSPGSPGLPSRRPGTGASGSGRATPSHADILSTIRSQLAFVGFTHAAAMDGFLRSVLRAADGGRPTSPLRAFPAGLPPLGLRPGGSATATTPGAVGAAAAFSPQDQADLRQERDRLGALCQSLQQELTRLREQLTRANPPAGDLSGLLAMDQANGSEPGALPVELLQHLKPLELALNQERARSGRLKALLEQEEAEHDRLLADIEQKVAEFGRFRRQYDHLVAERRRGTEELDRTVAERDAARNELEAVRQSRLALEDRVSALARSLHEKEAALERLAADVSQSSQQLEGHRDQLLGDLQAERRLLAEARSHAAVLSARVAALEARESARDSSLSESQRAKELEDARRRFEVIANRLTLERDNALHEAAAVRRELADSREQLSSLKLASRGDPASTPDDSVARLAELERLVQARDALIADLRAALQDSENFADEVESTIAVVGAITIDDPRARLDLERSRQRDLQLEVEEAQLARLAAEARLHSLDSARQAQERQFERDREALEAANEEARAELNRRIHAEQQRAAELASRLEAALSTASSLEASLETQRDQAKLLSESVSQLSQDVSAGETALRTSQRTIQDLETRIAETLAEAEAERDRMEKEHQAALEQAAQHLARAQADAAKARQDAEDLREERDHLRRRLEEQEMASAHLSTATATAGGLAEPLSPRGILSPGAGGTPLSPVGGRPGRPLVRATGPGGLPLSPGGASGTGCAACAGQPPTQQAQQAQQQQQRRERELREELDRTLDSSRAMESELFRSRVEVDDLRTERDDLLRKVETLRQQQKASAAAAAAATASIAPSSASSSTSSSSSSLAGPAHEPTTPTRGRRPATGGTASPSSDAPTPASVPAQAIAQAPAAASSAGTSATSATDAKGTFSPRSPSVRRIVVPRHLLSDNFEIRSPADRVTSPASSSGATASAATADDLASLHQKEIDEIARRSQLRRMRNRMHEIQDETAKDPAPANPIDGSASPSKLDD